MLSPCGLRQRGEERDEQVRSNARRPRTLCGVKVHSGALKHGVAAEDAVQAAEWSLWIEPLDVVAIRAEPEVLHQLGVLVGIADRHDRSDHHQASDDIVEARGDHGVGLPNLGE